MELPGAWITMPPHFFRACCAWDRRAPSAWHPPDMVLALHSVERLKGIAQTCLDFRRVLTFHSSLLNN
jgi:hypothetical protein